MKKIITTSLFLVTITSAFANGYEVENLAVAKTSTLIPKPIPVKSWMSPEVGEAWAYKYKGAGTKIFVVDDIKGSSGKSYGNLQDAKKQSLLSHGNWTSTQAKIVAPSASIAKFDWSTPSKFNRKTGEYINPVPLHKTYLNVFNASYGLMSNNDSGLLNKNSVHGVVADYANNGLAVVSKAAGNSGNGVGLDSKNSQGNYDAMNLALKNSNSTIFVGALSNNGTVDNKARIASYSNTSGSDPVFQSKYLMVGVEGHKTGLYGTSFAAPIVSGYAAIVRSKFKTATPNQVVNQLLSTARTDTIVDYNVSTHGRGEASLSRALAPLTIN